MKRSGKLDVEQLNRPNGGDNLFHSFRDFSVPTNGSAVFNNAPDIANIISRVTGGNISSIDGLIKANGSANLFLINPAGIIFGQNARLDIGGSFFGSTADSLLFPEGEFSAVNPDAPPLLTINIPIGLRFRDNPQPIANLSVADGVGLQVNTGQTLALMGGDILFTGGKITAPGSNIELGGLLATGTITLNDNFKFGFPEGVDRANVSFLNAAQINVASDGGGEISINAKNIDLNGESQLLGGIAEGLGNFNSQAGNIALNATGDISLDRSSRVHNQVEENATGNAGAIDVTTNNLSLTDGSQLLNRVVGKGNAGIVKIITSNAISIDGENSSGRNSGIFSNVSSGGIGNTEGVEITTANLNLTNGGTVSSSTFAQGNAGTVTINASDTIFIDDQEGTSSGIFSNIGISLRGLGGDSSNLTGILSLSPISSLVGPSAIGNGANITINTPSLSIANSAIATSTVGKGNAGNILINATDSISITENSQLQAVTFSEGNGGNIVIDAENADIFLSDILIGTSVIFSSDFSTVPLLTSGNGQGGDIKITGRTLSVYDGASLRTNTSGKATTEKLANAGNISLDISDSISFDGGSQLFISPTNS